MDREAKKVGVSTDKCAELLSPSRDCCAALWNKQATTRANYQICLLWYARLPLEDQGAEVQIVTLVMHAHGRVELAATGDVLDSEQLTSISKDFRDALANYQSTAITVVQGNVRAGRPPHPVREHREAIAVHKTQSSHQVNQTSAKGVWQRELKRKISAAREEYVKELQTGGR
jgi:hypothetical protein